MVHKRFTISQVAGHRSMRLAKCDLRGTVKLQDTETNLVFVSKDRHSKGAPMKMTQRNVTLALFSLLSIGTLLILVILLIQGSTQALLTAGSALLLQTTLLIVYWLGWEPTRYVALITQMLLIAFMPPGSLSGSGAALVLVIPPAQALILAGPAWVIATAVINYAILLLRADTRDA